MRIKTATQMAMGASSWHAVLPRAGAVRYQCNEVSGRCPLYLISRLCPLYLISSMGRIEQSSHLVSKPGSEGALKGTTKIAGVSASEARITYA